MRQNVSSGSKWEPLVGYSRAVRIGKTICVSGTVGVAADGSTPSDAYHQARRALEIIADALRAAGAGMTDVVRTRMFLTDMKHFQEVARAHGEVFGAIRPATSAVAVAGLVDPAFVVEIEADAVMKAE